MSKTIGLYMGRFQPFHSGHFSIVEQSLNYVDKLVIAVGSANISGTIKNPLSYNDRVSYIKDYIKNHNESILNKIIIIPLNSYYSDSDWVFDVNRIIDKHNINKLFYFDKKDGSSYWLPLINIDKQEIITNDDNSATKCRQSILEGCNLGNYQHWDKYRKYVNDINHYNNSFVHPYSSVSTHLTCDILIRYYADALELPKILLIKRNKGFGSGKYALIGGFVEPNETPEEAVIREFSEETTINKSFFNTDNINYPYNFKFFDHPNRSDRGRIITKCFGYDLTMRGYKKLNNLITEFVPNDEVSELRFVTHNDYIANIQYNMFEDHALIIKEMLKF